MIRNKILGKLIPFYKEHHNTTDETLKNDQIREKIEGIVNEIKKVNKITHEKNGNRDIKKLKKYSFNEQITLIYYQYLLKEVYEVKYVDRDYIIKKLLNTLPNINLYNEITVFKCDFEKFFESVSINKVIKILKENKKLNESEKSFLIKYLQTEKQIYPGIGLNNILIDIISMRFDEEIMKTLKETKVLSYSRYVDDIVIILNKKIDKDLLLKRVEKKAKEVFGEGVGFNIQGEKYCHYVKDAQNTEKNIDYLGYKFLIGGKRFEMGVSTSKIERIQTDIEKIFEKSKMLTNLNEREIYICTKLEVFFKRTVYFEKEKWKVRGISDSYKALKNNLEYKKIKETINEETLKMLSEDIKDIYIKVFNVEPSRVLKNQIDNEKFISLFFKNKSLVLDKRIGISYKALLELIEIIEVEDTTLISKRMGYKKAKKVFLKNTLKKT